MPVGGRVRRPFLDYVLSALADAGCGDVMPRRGAGPRRPSRAHYAPCGRRGCGVRFAVQPDPNGTAAAVLAAEPVVGDRRVPGAQRDNLYPVDVLRALVALDGPRARGVRARAARRGERLPGESRVAQFAVLRADADGWLTGIDEKPDPRDLDASGPHALISMNLWRIDHRIFDACRDVRAVRRAASTSCPRR